ncbi:hypothetical protein RI367_007671 [Sorochytrium milnesiophthora]
MSSGYKSFNTLQATLSADGVLHVQLHRPKQLNALNDQMFIELGECFTRVKLDADVRVVVLSSSSDRIFSAGLDLKEAQAGALKKASGDQDTGRAGLALIHHIDRWQRDVTAIEECLKPVIAVTNGACIGGAIDIITACDIRFCTQDATFTVKEVDIGMAADLGTLQRLPKVVGNQSLVRDWCFSGRYFDAKEALTAGLVSRVGGTRAEAIEQALQYAHHLAEKSPLALAGIKRSLVYSRDHSVAEGLAAIATWNSAMLQSDDLAVAVMAAMQKQKPKFAKL